MSKKKDKKLHNVKNHCNPVTSMIIDRYNLLDAERPAKLIAKVNQVTDLMISIHNQSDWLNIIRDAVDECSNYINNINNASIHASD